MTGIKYRSDIQGLRAIAVLAVMIFHFNPALLPGGFVGVDIFLVISGFLIASILFNKKVQTNYKPIATIKYFYVSRFKRLAPAYFSTLVVVSILVAILFMPADFAIYEDSFEKATYFNSNNYFANFGDYFAPANYEQPLLHTWSLAVEVQFYLIAPFIFLLLPRRLLRWLLPLSIISLTVYAEFHMRNVGQEQATYYSLNARLPAFFIGAWVALVIENTNNLEKGSRFNPYLVWLASALILTSFWLPKMTGYFPGIAGLIPIAGAALLILNKANSPVSKLLSNKVLVWLGTLSYSLYLWHWPVLAIIRYYTGAEILNWEYSLAFIALTLTLAVASYYWIETPLRLKRSKKQIIGYATLVTAILLTAVGMKKINALYTPESLAVEYTRYADPNTICHSKIVGDCLKGDLASNKEILVLGDSHAAMLNHFFDYLGHELNFKAKVVTASNCVTIPGFDHERLVEWAQNPCVNQIQFSSKAIEDSNVIFIAAMWTYHLQSELFVESLESFMNKIEAGSKKIIIMLQEPLLSEKPIKINRFKYLGFEKVLDVDENYILANERLKILANRYSNTKVLDLSSLEIFLTLPIYQDQIMYFDEHHLNEIGAVKYAELSVQIMKEYLSGDVF
jgi:peptidoglycan/LPS O-acetylase OafA/YrhL